MPTTPPVRARTRARLPDHAPVVIVGGGIIGVSILYHLAQRGVSAMLLERKKLGSGTTWHAAGIVGQLRDSSAQTELGKYTARLFRELEVETGQATGYRQNGTINLALGAVRHEQLRRSHDHAARMGIPSRLLSPEEVAERWPGIRTDDVVSGFHVPSNGQVNPLDVTTALARGARAHGATISEHTAAVRLEIDGGRVRGVVTDRGEIRCDQVVLAAGMWSHRFAKAHGITVPLHAAEHFYIVTEPVAGLAPDQPVLNISEERTYWKEDAGKLLIGGFEAAGKAWAVDGIPADFEFDELPFDMAHVEPELERMFARMPALADLGIRTFFNGPESFTPDGRPYLGPVPEVSGVFVATGMNSNGILNSGGVGLTLAEWLIDGHPSRSMGPLLANRAHRFQCNTRYNRTRAAESVGFHYGLAWAGRQVHSARGIRTLPLHRQLVDAGAAMAERAGWEVPMYFDHHRPARPWSDTPSLGWKPWSNAVRDECLAARDAAVLVDQSMYAKYEVQGADAVHALNRVCCAELDVPVGTSVYTPFLNARGGIEADLTVVRLASERFLVITGHPSQQRDLAWLRQHIAPGQRVAVFDATAAYGLLSVHGPAARAVLQSLSDDDLDLPFGAAAECDIAHARAWAIRRSFVGELGFELLLSTEFTCGVYSALRAAGEAHGLRHMGMFALNACRIEKGFLHFGHDIGEDDTPFEAGLGFTVRFDKADFIGREALYRHRAEDGGAPRNRVVCARAPGLTAERGPYLIHNEPVWRAGECIGHITSGDWGHRLDAMVGLAAVHADQGVTDVWLGDAPCTVQIAGEHVPIDLQLKPFYDPTGARMRA
ncbi:MAG: FAD-dependent oxidoreductase [Pseudomonadota bacterium]